MLLETGRVYCKRDGRDFPVGDFKHAVVPPSIHGLKPPVYGAVGYVLVPVGQAGYRFDHRRGRKQRVCVPERRAGLVPVGVPYLLASLGIATYDQRLAAPDVFLVIRLQPAALYVAIYSFFGA